MDLCATLLVIIWFSIYFKGAENRNISMKCNWRPMEYQEHSVGTRRRVLSAACIMAFISPAMGMMISLALVSMGRDLNVGAHSMSLIVTAFFVTSVIFLVPAARLSEIYGKKKVVYAGLIMITLFSLLASVSWDFPSLLVFRSAMGIGTSFILTASVSLLTDVYPPGGRGTAFGISTMFVYLGALTGPMLGGILTDALGWRSTFYIITPLAVAAMIMLACYKEGRPESAGEPFDYKGSVVFGVSIGLIMFGVFTLPSLYSIVLIAIGLMLLPYFVRIEKTVKYPALRLSMFSDKGYKSASVSLFLNYAAANAVVMMVSLYLQSVGELTASEAGTIMLVQPLFQVLLSPFSGKYSDKLDRRILPTVGMLSAFVGLLILSSLEIGTSLLVVVTALMFTGICHGLFGAPNTNVMMGLCSRSENSASASVIAIMRQSGMMVALGIAMFMISIFMGSTDNLMPSTYPDFINANRATFLVTAALALIGAIITWIYYPRKNVECPAEVLCCITRQSSD